MADPVPSTDPPRSDDRDDDPESGRRAGRPGRWGSRADGAAGAGSPEPADRSPSRRGPGRRRLGGSFWRELPILLVTALLLTFLIQTFLARVYVIPSASMEPTLHGCTGCTNDRVLVDKLVYRFGDPSPGDVVVFRGPESWGDSVEFRAPRSENIVVRGLQQAAAVVGLAPPDERDFVKRVVAVGGQTVQCCDDRNRVVVDGVGLDEPYAVREGGLPQESFGPVTVPEGGLWVMGDNRNNSADSRRHVDDAARGTVPVSNVIGKARVIVLPPGRWQGVEDTDPSTPVALGPAPSPVAGVVAVAALPFLRPGRPGRSRRR